MAKTFYNNFMPTLQCSKYENFIQLLKKHHKHEIILDNIIWSLFILHHVFVIHYCCG